MPVAIAVGNDTPPFVDSARSTLVTPTSSLADQVMSCTLCAAQPSPPAGDVSVTVGGVVSAGPVTVSDCGFEVPPPAAGVNTVMARLPGAPMSVTGIAAVNCVALTNVVTRSEPSTRTIEHGVNA